MRGQNGGVTCILKEHFILLVKRILAVSLENRPPRVSSTHINLITFRWLAIFWYKIFSRFTCVEFNYGYNGAVIYGAKDHYGFVLSFGDFCTQPLLLESERECFRLQNLAIVFSHMFKRRMSCHVNILLKIPMVLWSHV